MSRITEAPTNLLAFRLPPATGFFKPAFRPVDMLKQGIFGLNYFARATDEDFEGLDEETLHFAKQQTAARSSWKGNFFGVKAGMSYEWWKEKGLITPEDPLGWFHWYCRYYNGRRLAKIDAWQIARHQNFHRWVVQGRNEFNSRGSVSAVICQSLLQWSYDPNDCFVEAPIDNVRPPIPMSQRND